MSISLTQPTIGSVGWGGAVNTNWASIEDAINNKLIASGSLASRPSPATSNAGTLYFATDASGGTLYRSDGSSWSRVAPSVGATGYNYLINGGFDFAQRQAPSTFTTIADAAYGPDRWKCFRENAALQYSRTPIASGVNAGWFKKITNAGKLLIAQIVESHSVIALRGQTMQAQVTMQAGGADRTMRFAVLKWTGTADSLTAAMVSAWGAASTDPTFASSYAKITPTAGSNVTVANDGCTCTVPSDAPQVFSFSFTVPTDANNLVLVIFTDSAFEVNGDFVAANAGLYPGAGDREWAPRLTQQEWALCLSYFERIKGQHLNGPIGYIGYDVYHARLQLPCAPKRIETGAVVTFASGNTITAAFIPTGSQLCIFACFSQYLNPGTGGSFTLTLRNYNYVNIDWYSTGLGSWSGGSLALGQVFVFNAGPDWYCDVDAEL